MTNKPLKTLLLPLKRKEDSTMPTVKMVMLEKYKQWKDCPPHTFDEINENISDLVLENVDNGDNAGDLLLSDKENVVA